MIYGGVDLYCTKAATISAYSAALYDDVDQRQLLEYNGPVLAASRVITVHRGIECSGRQVGTRLPSLHLWLRSIQD